MVEQKTVHCSNLLGIANFGVNAGDALFQEPLCDILTQNEHCYDDVNIYTESEDIKEEDSCYEDIFDSTSSEVLEWDTNYDQFSDDHDHTFYSGEQLPQWHFLGRHWQPLQLLGQVQTHALFPSFFERFYLPFVQAKSFRAEDPISPGKRVHDRRQD